MITPLTSSQVLFLHFIPFALFCETRELLVNFKSQVLFNTLAFFMKSLFLKTLRPSMIHLCIITVEFNL